MFLKKERTKPFGLAFNTISGDGQMEVALHTENGRVMTQIVLALICIICIKWGVAIIKEYFALKVSNYLFQQTNLTVTMTGANSYNFTVI